MRKLASPRYGNHTFPSALMDRIDFFNIADDKFFDYAMAERIGRCTPHRAAPAQPSAPPAAPCAIEHPVPKSNTAAHANSVVSPQTSGRGIAHDTPTQCTLFEISYCSCGRLR